MDSIIEQITKKMNADREWVKYNTYHSHWHIERDHNAGIEVIDSIQMQMNSFFAMETIQAVISLLNKYQRLTLGIHAVKKALRLFERTYANDKRPRKAIESTENVLKCDFSNESIKLAQMAADNAESAYYHANCNRYPINNPAVDVAHAAHYLAELKEKPAIGLSIKAFGVSTSVRHDIRYDARADFAGQTTANEFIKKIINYGIKLLKETK